MIKPILYITLTIVISSMSHADTTYVENNISGVWDIEGSPYVIQRNVYIPGGDTLIIEPGVRVLLCEFAGIIVNRSTLIANGTEEDSIFFLPFGNNRYWATITIALNRGEFRYCHFLYGIGRHEMTGTITLESGFLIIENSTIAYAQNGISESGGQGMSLSNCYFKHFTFQAIRGYNSENVIIKDCIFDGEGVGINGQFTGCIFIDMGCNIGVYGNISNSIFINSIVRSGDRFINNSVVANNCFTGFDQNTDFFRVYYDDWPNIPDAGILDRTNTNGDSTDRYGNIFLDPGIVEGWEWGDEEFLREDSPCIDAGDPDSPIDPNSTIADIGPFFFSQPNIAVSIDSFAFVGTELGDSDTLFFSLRNRGDQKELRIFLDEVSLDRSFRIPRWEDDTTGLAAGDSVQFGLIFQPLEVREYLDTLRIFSNDRDEGLIGLTVRGVVANFVEDGKWKMEHWGLISVSPNPFNSSVTISFSSSSLSSSSLRIYDLSGRLVADLLSEHPPLTPPASGGGKYSVVWEAGNHPAGVYLVRLETGGSVKAGKLALVK